MLEHTNFPVLPDLSLYPLTPFLIKEEKEKENTSEYLITPCTPRLSYLLEKVVSSCGVVQP